MNKRITSKYSKAFNKFLDNSPLNKYESNIIFNNMKIAHPSK